MRDASFVLGVPRAIWEVSIPPVRRARAPCVEQERRESYVGRRRRHPYTESSYLSGFTPLDFLRTAALYLAANVGDP